MLHLEMIFEDLMQSTYPKLEPKGQVRPVLTGLELLRCLPLPQVHKSQYARIGSNFRDQ